MKKMKRVIQVIKDRFPENDLVKLPPIIALLTVAVGVLVSYIFADAVMQQSRKEFEDHASQTTATITAHVSTKLHQYEQLLLDTAGALNTTTQLTKQTWQAYISAARIIERYPSVLGIGYVEKILPSEVTAHEQRMRETGLPDYTVTPTGARSHYTAIIYLEPESAVNQRAIGYDMYSEPHRRAAMDQALATGHVVMSAPVQLVQDADHPEKRGTLFYYPVFASGSSPRTESERRSAMVGYVYIVVRPEDILKTLDKRAVDLSSVAYRLSDETANQMIVANTVTPPENSLQYDTVSTLDIFGRQWKFAVTSYQLALQRLTSPGILMLMGTALSILLGVGLHRLLKGSFEWLVSSHEETLEKTKAGLVALASHQLRTPASGVKQYLGILTQGFAGELTKEQQAIALKAYNANERQIETINQILHVAKADADQLALEMGDVDIVQVIRDITANLHIQAGQKDITIRLDIPTTCHIQGDERYIHMAIENLMSNAIKYSHSGGTVEVRLTKNTRAVRIAVTDQGVGIADDDIDKLFQKFSRIENPLSRQEGGSGLGLFLAYQIARAHGGTITITSTQGKGSRFTLSLPRKNNRKVRRP